MFTKTLFDTETMAVAALFSLAWFLVGLGCGTYRAIQAVANRSAKTGKPPRAGTKAGKTELYVGNLPYDLRSKDLRRAFEEHGKVRSVRIIENKFNGKSKGFAFVEMVGQADVHAAIKGMNGKEMDGRKLVVNEAKTRAQD